MSGVLRSVTTDRLRRLAGKLEEGLRIQEQEPEAPHREDSPACFRLHVADAAHILGLLARGELFIDNTRRG